MRRTTLKDIALQARLDISTISRVLNNDRALRISDGKRAEVQRIAEKLGYVPHRSARSLRLQRNFNIGYVLNDVTSLSHLQGDLESPLARLRIYGLEESLSARGYLLSLFRLPVANTRALEEKALWRHLVDGLVYNGYVPPPEIVQTLHRARFPLVLLDPFMPDEQYVGEACSVLSDRAAGVCGALKHLAAQGHRRIAFISARTNTRRLAGYRAAVEELGLSADSRLVRLFDPPLENTYRARVEGHRLAQELLLSRVPFTAVQAGSDATAAGVIDALRAAGRRVPDDASVIGYDDVEGLHASLFPEPFLSTVRDPNFEMGALAAELLIAQIEESAKPRQVMLQPELVLRASA